MKIIKEGVVKTFECIHCECVFETVKYKRTDITVGWEKHPDKRISVEKAINKKGCETTCPSCKNETHKLDK